MQVQFGTDSSDNVIDSVNDTGIGERYYYLIPLPGGVCMIGMGGSSSLGIAPM